MPVDVIIDPSSGQIYWNDNAGSGSTQSIAISGNANDSINFVGYSNFFTAGGAGQGTRILATFNDAITSTFVPGTNAYDLGSSSLRWNLYATGGNFTGNVSTSSSTASTSTTTGALTVAGGMGVVGDVYVASAANSRLNIMASSGDEGGEIFLNKAVTNTTLTTGVTVDVWQNRIRFFETGGTNRGAYIDLTACTTSVGTNLLAASGASGISSLNGLTATTQTFATGTSGTDFNISSSTSTHTFNIPYAGSGATGLVTTQAQTIAGSKTFSSQTIVSDTTASTSTATGALLVYGGLGVSAQVNAASMQLAGNAVINGNLQFKGVGTFGDSTLDTITSLARYASDLLPTADNTYDLGNNSLGWRNFKVSGVGTISTLQVTSVTSGIWSGTAISVSNGGTGRATLTASSVLLGNGTSAVGMTTGSSAQVLVWQSSGDPAFVSLSGDVTITAAGVASIAANSVALGTDTTGQYASTIAISGSGITATAAAGDDSTAYTIYSSATSANTASAIVLRDGSGNFTAGTITANLTGTASIASSSVLSATTTDTSSTLYLVGSRSSTGFAGTALYVDSNISILGSQITAGVWAGTAISAVNGGTGQVSYTIGDLLYASSTTALSKLAAGTAGSVLASGGAGAAPYWKVDATGGGGTPAGSTSWLQYNNGGSFGATSHLAYGGNGNNDFVVSAPYSGATQGQINIGLGITGFDGVTLGKFAGSASGTVIATNQASGFTGNFADFQLNGSSKFTIGYDGKITVVGVFSFPTTAGTAGSVLKSNGTGNQLYWAADATGAGGAGTVGSPSTSGLVAYYAGTGASVTSNSRVLIDSANSTVEINSQNSKSALILNAANGSVSNLAEFKNSFGDLFWAVGSGAQTLNATNGAALQIDSSSNIILTSPAPVLFYNAGQTFYTAITGSTTTSANVTFTLPSVAGTAGSVLTTAGSSGELYWSAAASGSGTITSGTANNMAYYTGTTTVDDATNFTYTTAGNGATMRFFGGASVGNTIFIVSAPTSTSIRVGIGTNNPQYELEIVGELSATNKSFVIDHPTKPNMKLRYGSLEGPENGVYVRGELKGSNVIETPDHWEGLVYPDSFTVTLTPIGRFAHLYVEKIEDYKVFIADAYMNPIHCYYTVWAERKDIPKLITEY